MSDLTTQLDEARGRWDTLRHPFYQRWERGELRRDELALYSGQYRHAVVALADLAAKGGDSEHAREERAARRPLGRLRRRLRRRGGGAAARDA